MSSSHDHPDPPCSLEIQWDAELDDHDTESPAWKPFSIREYVFSARGEHLSKNWPFPQKYMEVCIKHGVKALLPPFESPEPVRDLSKMVDEYLERDGEAYEGGGSMNISVNNEEKASMLQDTDAVLTGMSRKIGSLSLSWKDDGSNTIDQFVRFDKGGGHDEADAIPSSKVSTVEEFVVPLHVSAWENKTDHLVKDDDLFLNASEKVDKGSSFIREPISDHVSKSDFNHIMNFKPPRRKPHRCKMKGKKKRRIADICAEAQPCTIEDLDKKNGINWAFDSSITPYGELGSQEGKKGVESELPPSNISDTKLTKVLEFEDGNQHHGSDQTKQLRDDIADGGSFTPTKRRHLRITGLNDCTLSSFLRTKKDKNLKELAWKHRNKIMVLKAKQLPTSQIQDAGDGQISCRHRELTKKSPAANSFKIKPHPVVNEASPVLENFVKDMAQHGRKPRTVKRMRKVESITSCGLSVENTPYRSESELLPNDLRYHFPHAGTQSAKSYTGGSYMVDPEDFHPCIDFELDNE